MRDFLLWEVRGSWHDGYIVGVGVKDAWNSTVMGERPILAAVRSEARSASGGHIMKRQQRVKGCR